MFIVSLTYVKDLSEIDQSLDAHIAYLKKQYSRNKFIVSGRKVPRTGGIILVNANSLQEVDAIIAEDPFFQAKLADYTITEFIPTMTAPSFDAFKEFT
jgi:uncharacterized protein YciI